MSVPAPPELEYFLGDGTWGIAEIWGLSYDDKAESILASPALCKEWGLPADLVLLDGDGHTFVALDYRECVNEPPVIFIESDGGRWHVLANTFTEFLERLRPENDANENDCDR